MPNIIVTSQGIENLLNGLKTHKASGPDALSATILKETSDIIAPIPKVLFQISLDAGRVRADWSKALLSQFSRKAAIPYLPIIVQYHLLVSHPSYSNASLLVIL